MAKMKGSEEFLGGLHVGDNGRSGSFPNEATRRVGLSKGGVNKDLGGGAKSGAPQQVPAGKANDGNPGRQDSAGSSRDSVQRG
jgi:hypothetical protein